MTATTDGRERLRAWIAQTAKVTTDAVTDDAKIFGSGLLKSLHLMDLILLIEDIRGASVDPNAIGPGSFTNLDVICETFLAKSEAA